MSIGTGCVGAICVSENALLSTPSSSLFFLAGDAAFFGAAFAGELGDEPVSCAPMYVCV
jgi:hypothetical protein